MEDLNLAHHAYLKSPRLFKEQIIVKHTFAKSLTMNYFTIVCNLTDKSLQDKTA